MEHFISTLTFCIIIFLFKSINSLTSTTTTIYICQENRLRESFNSTIWTPPPSLRAPHSAQILGQLETRYGENLYHFQLKNGSGLQKTWKSQKNDQNQSDPTQTSRNGSQTPFFNLNFYNDGQNEDFLDEKNFENEGGDEFEILDQTFRKNKFFTPLAYLKIQTDERNSSNDSSATFLNPLNYCLVSQNKTMIETKWSPPSHPFIPKCCPPGFVFAVNLSASEATSAFIGCKESSVDWLPSLFERLEDNQPIEKDGPIHFNLRVLPDWRKHCKSFTRYTIPRRLPPLPTSTTDSAAYRRKLLRILDTGEIYSRISGNHVWKLERKKKIWDKELCIDGTWDVERTSTYEPSDENQILITCKPHQDKTGIRRLYVFIILTAAFFLLLIIVIYGSIWPQLTTHGWTVTFLALSMFLWFLAYATSLAVNYRGGLPLAETPLCVALGVLVHFFHLATFAWMTVMNFDLWSSITSKTIRPTTGPYRKQQFCSYACFAFGVPTIVVTIGGTLEAQFGRFDDRLIRPQYGQWRCTVDDTAFLQYVLSVDLIMLCLNLLLGISTGRHMWAFKRRAKRVHGAKSELDLYRRLFVVCGFSWILDIVMYWVDPEQLTWIQTIVNFCNILQAVTFAWIFLSKKDIQDKFVTRIKCGAITGSGGTNASFFERSSRST